MANASMPTLTDHNLTIEGMKGDACVKKVTDTLKLVPDVVTRSVSVGSASISANDQGCTDCCEAVTAAGYKTKEATANANSKNSANPGQNSGNKSNPSTPVAHGTDHSGSSGMKK